MTKKIQIPQRKAMTVLGIVVVLMIGGIGTYLFTASHAVTPFASTEAENGTLSGGAAKQGDTSASGGNYVQFGGNTSSADPSGASVPIGDQPGWHQIFYDNFAGENVPLGSFSGCTTSPQVCTGLPQNLQSKWWDYPDTWPDTEQDCQYWPSQTMSIAGGIMNMYIHTASNGTCMTAVPEPLLPNPTGSENGQLYGMYSVRMRADPLPDYITAFLLWPDDETWPQDGEIDFPNSSLTSNTIDAYMHREGGTSGADQDYFSTSGSQSTWHTYTIQWAPTYVNFLVDGKSIGESTSRIPDTPMHWVLQTESDTVPTVPDPGTAGNLQVDWVSIWSYDPSAT